MFQLEHENVSNKMFRFGLVSTVYSIETWRLQLRRLQTPKQKKPKKPPLPQFLELTFLVGKWFWGSCCANLWLPPHPWYFYGRCTARKEKPSGFVLEVNVAAPKQSREIYYFDVPQPHRKSLSLDNLCWLAGFCPWRLQPAGRSRDCGRVAGGHWRLAAGDTLKS